MAIQRIHIILFLLIPALFLSGCNLFDGNSEQTDTLEDGPFHYSLKEYVNEDVQCETYRLVTQWAEIGDPGSVTEVQAGLHASVRDTVDNIVKWQRYNIIFIRKNGWPDRGLFTPAGIEEVRRGDSDQFYIYFNSLYRENGMDGINHVFIDDYGAFAESGSIEITTSTESSLRGTFSLDLNLIERRTWDGSEETVETSFQEHLGADGAFDIDLTRNKVNIVSSLPHQSLPNQCDD